jgi:hypothetical protein
MSYFLCYTKPFTWSLSAVANDLATEAKTSPDARSLSRAEPSQPTDRRPQHRPQLNPN